MALCMVVVGMWMVFGRMGPAPGPVFPPAANVLAEFEFNNNTQDSSGNGRDATLLGGEFVASPFGQGLRVGRLPQSGLDWWSYIEAWIPALLLPAPSGQGMQVVMPPPSGIDWSQYAGLLVHPYTIEMILIPKETVAWQKLFSFDDAEDAGWYYKDGGIQAYPHDVLGGGQMQPDGLHYLAFVARTPDQVAIYFQGQLVGLTDASFIAPPAQAIFFKDDRATAGEQLSGVIEALRISSVARTPAEILFVQQMLAHSSDREHLRPEARPGRVTAP